MADAPKSPQVARAYTPTALPSVTARWLAFLAIVLGGVCGGLIGWSVTDLQCGTHKDAPVAQAPLVREPRAQDSGCTYWAGGGGIIGGAMGAGGTGVVSVLVLRAMSEWRRELELDDDDQ